MIAIVDYGAGNIFSVKNALDYLGLDSRLTDSAEEIEAADKVILPGVGAFPAAMEMLHRRGLVEVLRTQAKQKPLLGICLGMQMLLEKSYEFEVCEGLGLIPGTVERIDAPGLIIPHMGWNKLERGVECPLLQGLPGEAYVYFVHSYAAKCRDEHLAAWVGYGGRIPALVYDGAYVFGAQFHPEKSGEIGLQILRNFGAL
ncbi:MAG: imidazole glycerol phosphate synthase subunit HisH [Oscillospiraceae bacterium]|nr:imidazole glycerol phosphate synthase subunit HisH [Oscillospiraceae bacterium]